MTDCEHNDMLLVMKDDGTPMGLVCNSCQTRWPVGPPLPRLYDWQAEAFGDLDDEQATTEQPTVEVKGLGDTPTTSEEP